MSHESLHPHKNQFYLQGCAIFKLVNIPMLFFFLKVYVLALSHIFRSYRNA